MKNKKKMAHLPVFGLIFALLFVVACDSPTSPSDEGTPSVTSVTISPNNSGDNAIRVEKGKQRQFTATVIVTGGADKTVTWTVTGKNSNSTNINSNGLLTVAADETAGTLLTVKATSTVDNTKFGTATVTVVNEGEGPKVNSVTINGRKNVIVEKGADYRFTATVDADEGADKTVTWTVTGNNSNGTNISNGLLTVAADETAETLLTVKATSTVDNTKSDTATVTVVNEGEGPKVTSVTINGERSVSVEKGANYLFTATVVADEDASPDVNWTVAGNNSSNTNINAHGLLTVAVNETATLTVRAESPADNTKFDTVTVTVTDISTIWLVGIPHWELPGKKMTKETNGTFTWEDDVATDSTFRFSLTDTSGWTYNEWNGNWFAPEDNETPVKFTSDGNIIKYYGTNTSENATEATNNAWAISAGYYRIILNPAEMKMFVEEPVVVVNVEVHGPNDVVRGSNTAGFTVTVTGHNDPAQTVTWSVEGGGAGTSITPGSGILTVASGEAATQLIIRATSTVSAISGIKTVTLSSPGAVKLDPVPKPALSNAGIASWGYTADADVVRYEVQLSKDDVAQDSPELVAKGTFTKDFRSVIQNKGAGTYTVTVIAIGNGTTWSTSNSSDHSDEKVFTQRSVRDVKWNNNDTAQWGVETPDPYSSGTYTVKVNKTGQLTPIATKNVNETDWYLAPDGVPSEVDASYYFTVIANGDGGLALDSTPVTSATGAYHVLGNSSVWTIVKGGSVYLAGADNGKIAYSDGTEWYLAEQDVFGIDHAVRGIAYAAGKGDGGSDRFVAVGYNGQIGYSDDGGEEWHLAARNQDPGSPFDGRGVLGIAYDGTSFVAGGDNGILASSPDGKAWSWVTSNGQGSPFDDKSVLGIAGGDGIFVAVGESGKVAYFGPNTDSGSPSPTLEWRWISNDLFAGNNVTVNNVAFGNGVFVAAGDNGKVKWAEAEKIKSYGNKWYAWGDGPSTDAVETGFGTTAILNIVFSGDKFIAVGADGKAATSGDGATWSSIASTQFGTGQSITAAIALNATEILLAGPGKFSIVTP